MSSAPDLSFVIPVYNEAATLAELFQRIRTVVETENLGPYEVLFIDDGSVDDSWGEITRLHFKYPREVRGLRFRTNFGKAAALAEAFREVRGEIVVTLDADLQDDPREIPAFLNKLQEGYDLVSGWKRDRQDPWHKTIPSKLFNVVTCKVAGIHIHDFNCGFKAYRREVVKNIRIYGELHRYIPVLAHGEGFRIGEIPVVHHARTSGVSKYGWRRYFRGFLDLLTVMTTTRYLQRPAHLFGGLGLLLGIIGLGILTYLTVMWFAGYRGIGGRPLFFFGILFTLLSGQLLSLGLIAELLLKTSNEDNKRHYAKERLDCEQPIESG